MTKKTFLTTIAALPAIAVTAFSQTTAARPKHKAVFQMTDPKGQAWDLLFLGLGAIQRAFANDGGVEVEVVCFRAGVTLLKKDNVDYAERLQKMKDSGITFDACQNAMRAFNLKSEDMSPVATEVDAGVAQLTRKQEQGFAYIH